MVVSQRCTVVAPETKMTHVIMMYHQGIMVVKVIAGAVTVGTEDDSFTAINHIQSSQFRK
ncbi:hypothetical protein F511_42304 [Dorcoceras hygrometricum]|uniref:Uncharacterized protein n=1 Tax=Dorcoceras hygrometricum TaxID=472368 RepID=A0A2Z6ZZJ6_9LAMI|nr:hypothetical protein F511_42304 [Dorcoceras hygrometricum]